MKTVSEYRTLWVDALRSGTYPQAQRYLRRDTGFCCLGVLCDLVKDEVDGEWIEAYDGYAFLSGGARDNFGNRPRDTAALPLVIRDLVDLGTNLDVLMFMNDVDHKSFDEIADYIEALPV